MFTQNYFYELCDDVQAHIMKMKAQNMIYKNYKTYCDRKKIVTSLFWIPDEDMVLDSSFVAFLFYLSRNPSIKFAEKKLMIRTTWRNLCKLRTEIGEMGAHKLDLYCASYEYAAILLDHWNDDEEQFEYLLTLLLLKKKVWKEMLKHM